MNIWCGAGWVVQNVLIDLSDGPGPIRSYGRLGIDRPQRVTLFNARVEFTAQPLVLFQQGRTSVFNVTPHIVNARGAGIGDLITIAAPPRPDLVFFADEQNFSYVQPNAVNIETAQNQCFPMSIANSLQYLENRYGINIPNDHKPGLKGDNSLVGQLDTEANRTATSRTSGSGVWFQPMLQGKFSYLSKNNLANDLSHSHQGQGYGNAASAEALPAGDFTAGGITSKNEGSKVTWEWLCAEIREGNDVELVYSYDDNAGMITGGHAVRVVGCGMTLGRPWVKYLHDGTQSNDSSGTEIVQVYVHDADNDGTLNLGSAGQEIRFAMSESVTQERKNSKDAPPIAVRESFVNAASFDDRYAPGSIASAFGSNLVGESTSTNLRALGRAQEALLPTALNGATVMIDGIAAPLYYVGPYQINFQVPSSLAPGEVSAVVAVDGKPSLTINLTIQPLGPGIFLLDPSIAGEGRGVIQNQDFTVNLPDNRAIVGEAIVVYLTGLGAVDNPVPDGAAAPTSPLSWALADVQATLGSQVAEVVFAGLTPGFVGLSQVNVIVPPLAAGDHRLVITADGVASNEVLVAVSPE